MNSPLMFVISAPAGTGKTTLVNLLTKEFPNTVRSVSCTTRAPRAGEESGKDYYFLTKGEFETKIRQGDFLEYAQVFGDYYGTSKEFVKKQQSLGKHVILVVDTQGALQLKDKIPAIFIFITAPSFDVLKERLKRRNTESQTVMDARLKWAQHELEMISHYDYHIVNDNLETAYTVLKSILIAEEHKVRRNP